MIYFAERFGMVPFGTIEIRPGVDPTPSHVADLIERMRRAHVDVVVRELSYPATLAETVARERGAKLVELPSMAGGVRGVKDYISFIAYTVRTMVKAVMGREVGGGPERGDRLVASSESGHCRSGTVRPPRGATHNEENG